MGLKDQYYALEGALDLMSDYRVERTTQGLIRVVGLKKYRHGLHKLLDIPRLEKRVSDAMAAISFLNSDSDKANPTAIELDRFVEFDSVIKGILNGVLSFVKQGHYGQEDIINIKLPPLITFEDLSKVANELKRGIEIPINSSGVEGGSVQILSAEPGSIWVTIAVGSKAALYLVGSILKKATDFMKDLAEARTQLEYARNLRLQNDALEAVVKGVEVHTNNLLDKYASDLANGSASNEDLTAVYKMAISSCTDMMQKGARFLPESKNSEIKAAFPEPGKLPAEDIQGHISDG